MKLGQKARLIIMKLGKKARLIILKLSIKKSHGGIHLNYYETRSEDQTSRA